MTRRSFAMDNANKNEKALFAAARGLTDPAQRRAFLDQSCAADSELRQRVEELLQADGAAGDFLHELLPETQAPGEATAPPNRATTIDRKSVVWERV